MRKIVEHGLDEGGPLFCSDQLRAQTLAQHVDRHQRAVGVSNCQKVQPLQASSPCTCAPI